jgi:hypothetical protein
MKKVTQPSPLGESPAAAAPAAPAAIKAEKPAAKSDKK